MKSKYTENVGVTSPPAETTGPRLFLEFTHQVQIGINTRIVVLNFPRVNAKTLNLSFRLHCQLVRSLTVEFLFLP